MANKKILSNPFPGLRPFQSDEEHLFFGRETQTLELLQILRDNRFVGVIGTSGSGKSSLVRCGLLSELYGGLFLKAGTDWEVAVMNPGGGPFNQLSKSLVASDIYDSEEADVYLKLNATLRRSRLGLVEAIRQAKLPEGTNFLLVVDQFEEIFRYSEAGEEEGEAADDFISMILEAAKQSNIPIYVIITMRSDYIGDCSKFEGLPEEINEGEYLIPRLSREEYKSVIEGPVRVGGAKLAPRLLQRLLNDIGTESDQLPCLQHALMRTWDAWADRDGAEELDLEDYRAIGGMGKALSIHADEIFDTFSDEGTRETATRMFRAITEKGDDNRGIRRPLRLQQLADITDHSIEEVKSVVDPYRQQGVTFLMPPSNRELEPDTVIDISHESLMRVWQRLRNWVEEEAQSARIYRRLVDTSSLWKKEEAGLYYDPDLQIAQSWRDKYQPNEDWADLYGGGFEVATEFLEASEKEGRKAEREKELARQKELEQAQELAEARERSAKNMKRFAAVVGVVAIIALGAMVFAVKAQKKAVIAQDEAVEAKGTAESARETLRKEFIKSDINLGLSFSEQNQASRGLAHFARALEREPDNPSLIDRTFNLLAYDRPPGYRSPKLNLQSDYIETSTATQDGTTVITAIHASGNSEFAFYPGDGFSLNYGNANIGNVGAGEEGMAGKTNVSENLSYEIHTWKNDMQGFHVSGISKSQDLGDLATKNGVVLETGSKKSGTVEIIWNPLNGASFKTKGMTTNADFNQIDVGDFKGNDSYNFIISAKVGESTQNLSIDNLSIVGLNSDTEDKFEYKQNFDDYENGSTEIRDGSIISGESASIQDGKLVLTISENQEEITSLTVPAIKGSSKGFMVKFDYEVSHPAPNLAPNLMVWTPGSDKPKHMLSIYPGKFQSGNDISISPDGKFAALALDGIHLLDLEHGSSKEITNSNTTLRGVTFSADGKRLLTGTGQFHGNVAQVWEASTGKLLNSYETKAFFPSWSPDETKILYPLYRRGKSAIFDIASNSLKTFDHEGVPGMTDIGIFDRTGERFLSISQDQRFNVWNIESGELEFYVQHNNLSSGFNGAVGVFTPDNQKLITIARDLFIRLWSAKDGRPIDSVNIASRHAFGQKPIFSSDGRRMIIALQNGNAYTLNFDEKYSNLSDLSEPIPITEAYSFLAESGEIKPLIIPLADVTSGTVMPNKRSVLLGSSNGSTAIFDLETGIRLSEYFKVFGSVISVATSEDGEKIAVASDLGFVKVWNRKTPSSPSATLNFNAGADSNNPVEYCEIHFNPNGNELWVSDERNSTKWNLNDEKITLDTGIRPTKKLSVSSKDNKLTAIISGALVRIYNNTKEAEPVIINVDDVIDAVCFSNDNSFLLTGSNNGKIRLWLTESGALHDSKIDLELVGNGENIDSITISDDLKFIAAGCKSGNVYVFDFEKIKGNENSKDTKKPAGEVYRSLLLNKDSPETFVEIEAKIEGAQKLFLVVEDGGDQWQHDVANWIEPKIIVNGDEKLLTSMQWVSATTNWQSVKINQNVAGNFLEVGGQSYLNGIGTHSFSIIEYDLPEGANKFQSLAGIDDKALNFNNGKSLSSVRFSIYIDNPPPQKYPVYPVEGSIYMTKIKGALPCESLSFNTSGNLLACNFTDSDTSYAQVWVSKTGFPITKRLESEDCFSEINFHNNGSQILLWPESTRLGTSGICSLWDVSLSKELSPNPKYSEIIRAFGKLELNEDSNAVKTTQIGKKLALIEDLESKSRLKKFFNWLEEFPSTRSDSPFRKVHNKKYINELTSQNSITTVKEAVRLSRSNAKALVKLGALRLVDPYAPESTLVKAFSGITKATLIAPNDVEVTLYAAIAHERMGNVEKSEILYSKAKDLTKLELQQILNLINIQEALDTGENGRQILLDRAIKMTKNNDLNLNKGLTLKRFNLFARTGNLKRALEDWKMIKEWDDFPVTSDSYEFEKTLQIAIEYEADDLILNGRYDEAIELIKPSAIASLFSEETNLSSSISKLIEWENRETPPINLVAASSTWDYFDKGTNPGSEFGEEWFQPGFVSEGWLKGPAKLGYGGDGEITQVDFGGDLGSKHIAYYFRHSFQINKENKPRFLIANVVRDDGVIVYLNGKEVIRDGMPDGPVSHTTPAKVTRGPEQDNRNELEVGRFAINGEFLKVGENVISAQVHQTGIRSSDLGFQLELLGSNNEIKEYVKSLFRDKKSSNLISKISECLTKSNSENAKKGLQVYLTGITDRDLKNLSLEEIKLAISIAEKLEDKDLLKVLTPAWVNAFDLNPSTKSTDLTKRAESLNEARIILIKSGASREEIDRIENKTASPPRKSNLSDNLIDLSQYYNASLFHYSNWHAVDEKFDLRFLPEKYDGPVDFDLRGIIQLNSGLDDNGKTVNENAYVLNNYKKYPNSVKTIEINSKAQKAHFLVGAIFGHEATTGKTAMKVVFNYSDGSKSEMDIKAQQDIFDWFSVGNADKMPIENIGFLGENNLGNKRFLQKPIWINPHPEKIISHIDLISGLIKMAPFVVAITFE
jgi:WD40 repeat protein